MRFFVLCIKAKEFARQTTPCRPVEILRTELTTRRFKALHSFTLGNCLVRVCQTVFVCEFSWLGEWVYWSLDTKCMLLRCQLFGLCSCVSIDPSNWSKTSWQRRWWKNLEIFATALFEGGARCKDHRCVAQIATALWQKVQSTTAAGTTRRSLGMPRGSGADHVFNRHLTNFDHILWQFLVISGAAMMLIWCCQVTKEEFFQKCLAQSKPCVTAPVLTVLTVLKQNAIIRNQCHFSSTGLVFAEVLILFGVFLQCHMFCSHIAIYMPSICSSSCSNSVETSWERRRCRRHADSVEVWELSSLGGWHFGCPQSWHPAVDHSAGPNGAAFHGSRPSRPSRFSASDGLRSSETITRRWSREFRFGLRSTNFRCSSGRRNVSVSFEKGFCVLRLCGGNGGEAIQAMQDLAEEGQLGRLPEEVEEGYLGLGGKGRVLWLDPESKRDFHQQLLALDQILDYSSTSFQLFQLLRWFSHDFSISSWVSFYCVKSC